MLKLVIITAVCLGLQSIKAFSPEDVTKELEVLKEEASSPFNSKAGLSPKTQFYCHKRPSGYYADPRFNCEVFHFCHEDGTRVTIPCGGRDNHKNKICLLKDIAIKACDGATELYLALPQDLFFKASKDTTASALNGATNYKVPEVLPEPDEDRVSTTPLSPQGYRYDDIKDEGIYEVFNSFLKEIEGGRNLEATSDLKPRTINDLPNSRPRPATFSRGSRVPSSLEHTDALIDAPLAGIGRRVDGDSALLVEIYDDKSDNNDYSSYSRKAKKLFPTSDKKTPAKHPRRRKRTVGEQQFNNGRPYAIIYAKLPDRTLPGSISGFQSAPSATQERRGVFSSGEVPMVPITIETRRKKKSKSKKKSVSSEQQPQTIQQTSEQQNIFFYTPDQVNGAAPLSGDGRTRVDPRQRVTGTRAQSPRQQLSETPQQGQQSSFSGQSPYPNLQIPSFPFQAQQQYANAPRQPSYFFTPQDGYSPFASPFRPPQQQQFQQPQSQQVVQRPQSQRGIQPSQRPSGGQESPASPQGMTGTTEDRPSSLAQGYQRFQNPFFESFTGFGGGAPFGGPYTQRDPSSYSLLPPGQIPQQPPPLPPQPFLDTARPQIQPQSIPESPRPEDPRLYSQAVPQQDRTRHPSEDSQPSPISSQQRPPRNRVRPTSNSEISHPQSSGRVQENPSFQRPRQPSIDTVTADRNRQRPQQYIPNDPPIVYQPEYAPPDLILQPENPSNPSIRNGYPHEQPQVPSRPVILLEDLTQQDRRPQNPEDDPREVVYNQRQPIPERPQRRPEQSRRPKPPQQQEDQRQQPSRYISPTPPPPSSRTRQRQPTRNERQRQIARPVEESAVPNDVDENPDYGHRTAPPPDEKPSNVRTRPESNRVLNRYNPIPPSPPIPQRRPPAEVRRPSSEVSGDHRQQSVRPTRYQSNPRNRPREGTQPQIERPPSEYVAVEPQPEIYSGPPGYYTYPPHGNDVNIVSTANELEDRPHTPPSTRHQHSHRQPTSNLRNPANSGDPQLQLGFLPMTEQPYQESYYRTRPTIRDHTEAVEEYNVQDKTQSNRYQDINEEQLTTRQVATTRRPTTQKPRPPPPKPTFPTFPTFPPPPRRTITSPKPKTDPPEIQDKNTGASEYASSNPDQLVEAVLRSTSQFDALAGTERLRNNKEYNVEDSPRTDAPEVTTRRRTRKKKQRPRKPRPTESYSNDGYTSVDIITQPTTEKEVISRSTSSRQNRWQKQTTSQPRRASVSPPEEGTTETSVKAEEFGSRINLFSKQRSRNPNVLKPRIPATTQSSSLARGESSRSSKSPTVIRSRKPLNSRVRTRTTTTTEFPDTLGPIARSDDNSQFLYYHSEDFTTESSTSFQEYEPMTMVPVELTTESTYTESYNEVVEPTPEDLTLHSDGVTDIPEDESQKMGDFESTRSVAKKFQNRPRILKFGKPKLRTTTSPINMNADIRTY